MLDRQLYNVILHALGPKAINEYPENFKVRVKVQKVLYILTHSAQAPKMNLPYGWTFYLRGPYSAEIAHMIYYMKNFSNELAAQQPQINLDEKNAIEHYSKFIATLESKNSGLFLNEEELFEALATLIYITQQQPSDRQTILKKFRDLKPNLEETIPEPKIDVLLDSLEQFHYI